MALDARNRELLYDHDKGLVRVRRDFKKKAEKQLAARCYRDDPHK